MTETSLNFDSLKRALSKLHTGLSRALKNPDDEEVRDGCIQRFEYCLELSWKLLKRQLELEENPEEVDSFSKKNLFRVGAEKGLVENLEKWFGYLEMRNLTSHTYNEETANTVFKVVPDFLDSAKDLLKKLEHRHGA